MYFDNLNLTPAARKMAEAAVAAVDGESRAALAVAWEDAGYRVEASFCWRETIGSKGFWRDTRQELEIWRHEVFLTLRGKEYSVASRDGMAGHPHPERTDEHARRIVEKKGREVVATPPEVAWRLNSAESRAQLVARKCGADSAVRNLGIAVSMPEELVKLPALGPEVIEEDWGDPYSGGVNYHPLICLRSEAEKILGDYVRQALGE